jgi:hypothetical protein
MQNKERTLIWIGVIAVIVGIFIIVGWKPQDGTTPQGGGTSAPVPVTYAPQGQVVPQFPQELILDANPSVTQSYSINYSSSTNQYTAQWNSTTAMSALVTKYKNYFSAHGWSVTDNDLVTTTAKSLSASTSTASVLVTILSQPKGSQVTVSYLVK